MPRYFFDTDDGEELLRDIEGTELSDLEAARNEATTTIAEMCRDHIPEDGPFRQMAIHVRDDAGKHLFTVSISFATEPSV